MRFSPPDGPPRAFSLPDRFADAAGGAPPTTRYMPEPQGAGFFLSVRPRHDNRRARIPALSRLLLTSAASIALLCLAEEPAFAQCTVDDTSVTCSGTDPDGVTISPPPPPGPDVELTVTPRRDRQRPHRGRWPVVVDRQQQWAGQREHHGHQQRRFPARSERDLRRNGGFGHRLRIEPSARSRGAFGQQQDRKSTRLNSSTKCAA